MQFDRLPPGTADKGEAAPPVGQSVPLARIAPVRHPPVPTTPPATSPTRWHGDRPPLRGQLPARPPAVPTGVPWRALISVAARWFGYLIPAAFVTQIWAGSQFSPGQGGGFTELIGWVALFGAALLAMVGHRGYRADPDRVVRLALRGCTIGWFAGVTLAITWFSSKGGPRTGEWFVAPLTATIGAALALYAITPHAQGNLDRPA